MKSKDSCRIKPAQHLPRRKQTHASQFAKFLNERRRDVQTCLLLMVLFALLFGISIQLPPPIMNTFPQGATVVDYTTFISQVKAGNMQTATIQGDELTGTLAHPLPRQTCSNPSANTAGNLFSPEQVSSPAETSCTIYARLPPHGTSSLSSMLLSHHVVIKSLPAQPSLVWLVLVVLGFMPVIILLLSGGFPPWQQRDDNSFDSVDQRVSHLLKSRMRRVPETPERDQARPSPAKPPLIEPAAGTPARPASPVTFADVAGIDEVRAELEEVVQFLRSPERFRCLGAHVPRGILLVGPPGTGKTLLAKAVAGEARVPFFSMSASEFVEMFVGVGASRVRDLFHQVRQSAPCVVFIDEIDSVGRKRSLRLAESGERDQTLNQLLIELDGFDGRNTIIVLAATNRVDMLDEALLRPGRFDRQLSVMLPDRRGREAILRVHTRQTPLHARVRLDDLARLTTGMSGADLANLVNEAALCAARQELASITQECFEEALARIQLGAQRSLVMSETERRIIAYHESGHALVAYYLPEVDPVSRITILPRGQHLGVTQFTSQEDRYTYSRANLMARIAVGLAGRMAVELVFGSDSVTTKAEDDLQAVTALAQRMVARWGMSSKVGVVFADSDASDCARPSRIIGNPHPLHIAHHASSASMVALIDGETRCILQDGRTLAHTVLAEHYLQLTALAESLLQHEQLDRAQFEAMLR
jgi:cell division protease FtsH